jgi:hypothetical protein
MLTVMAIEQPGVGEVGLLRGLSEYGGSHKLARKVSVKN